MIIKFQTLSGKYEIELKTKRNPRGFKHVGVLYHKRGAYIYWRQHDENESIDKH